jgi:formate dehydrogenase subunit gamma
MTDGTGTWPAIDDIVEEYAAQPGGLLPMLHAIQERCGYVPPGCIPQVAQGLNLTRAEVHGIVHFYHYFRHAPPGRHLLQVCRAEACQALHGERTEAHARARLGEGHEGTGADGTFSLEPVYCLGNCALGPSVMIDGTLYGRVTPERLDELLDEWRDRS